MPPTSPSAGVRSPQLVDGPALLLRRHHQRAVLDQRTLVDQVGDVLASRALAQLASPLDGVGPVLVETVGVALEHLGQVGADLVEVDVLLGLGGAGLHLGRLEQHQLVTGEHRVADVDTEAAHDAAAGRGDHVLHLHRLHHRHLRARGHLVADADRQRPHRALHRRRTTATSPSVRSAAVSWRPPPSGRARARRAGRCDRWWRPAVRRRPASRAALASSHVGVDAPGTHVGVTQQRHQEVAIGVDALDPERLQRLRGGVEQRCGPVGVHHELGQQRVVAGAGAVALEIRGVGGEGVDPVTGRRLEPGDGAAGGHGLAVAPRWSPWPRGPGRPRPGSAARV